MYTAYSKATLFTVVFEASIRDYIRQVEGRGRDITVISSMKEREQAHVSS